MSLQPLFGVFALALVASCATGLPYDPYSLSVDHEGFAWDTGKYDVIAIPAAKRFKFLFNATSEAPCTEIRKMFSVLNSDTGRPVARPSDLPRADGEFRVQRYSNATYSIVLRAMVLVPNGDGAWAVADTPFRNATLLF